MSKQTPSCGSCDFCHHPIWRITRALKKRWIPAKEKGNTSPAWCPLRVPAKEG